MNCSEKLTGYGRNTRDWIVTRVKSTTARVQELARDPQTRRAAAEVTAEITLGTLQRLAATPPLPEGSPVRARVHRVGTAAFQVAGTVFERRVDTLLRNQAAGGGRR